VNKTVWWWMDVGVGGGWRGVSGGGGGGGAGAKFFAPIQTGHRANPTSYSVSTGSLPWG